MPTISTLTARAEFTNALIAVYKERKAPSSFLRSFFKPVVKSTLSVSIAVRRGSERIAVDVERGTDGNRNSFNKTTEKIFVPPYYSEYFNINELDVYNSLFTSENIELSVFNNFLEVVVEEMVLLQDKIERAYELQAAQALSTGIIQLQGGVNIDFKRKAASLVDLGAGNYWADANVDPVTSIIASGDFLRKTGKMAGATLDVILPGNLISTLTNNTAVQNRGKIFQYSLDQITTPQRDATGAALNGVITAGTYTARLWSYNEFYEDAAGVMQPLLDPKKMIVLPENPMFHLAFAAVPQLPSENGGQIKTGAYVFEEYTDQRKKNHIMEVQSAGVAILTGVDQVVTVKVLA